MDFILESRGSLGLRMADQADKDFAYRVKKSAFRAYAEEVWGWREDEQRELHERQFREGLFFVISVDGQDIGIMSLSQEPDCLALNQLYIVPEHQGQGIGRRCMAIVMEQAEILDVPIRLRVLRVNPRAMAFYESLGFAKRGETDTHILLQKLPVN